jgi:carboxyl-terminal processing protease
MRLKKLGRLSIPLSALALASGTGAWLACATPSLPPAQPASAIAEQTYLRVQNLYLRPQEVDGRVMTGALEALEQRFDPIRFEPNGRSGTLFVGDERVIVPIEERLETYEFLTTLGGALSFVQVRLGPEASEELGPDETLELLALRGALGSLDRYSTIFSGKGTEDFQIRFSGKLQWIGSRIGRRDGELLAVRVFPGSPAEKAGLEDGDAIRSIDGEPTRPMTVSEAVTKIRGQAGTSVLFDVGRGDEELQIEIIRGTVRVPSVETEELAPGLGYARIFSVSRSTPVELKEKVAKLGKLEGLVLDLRSNTGGSMLASARLADMFVPSGTIVRTVGRDGEKVKGLSSHARATPRVVYSFPVVVLIDHSTASAAEILAGAIGPLPHVTLVGQRTFGKGVVQRIYTLPEENLLKLTVAEYLLSDDRAIHMEGIDPDIELYPVSTSQVAPLANAPSEAIPYLRTHGEDDRFPIEAGQILLEEGVDKGRMSAREKAEEAIVAHLAEMGIEWTGREEHPLPDMLPEGLDVRTTAPLLEAGKPARIEITVYNPNPFAVPSAWLTLEGPLDDLGEKALPLGTLPPGGSAKAVTDVEPPEGLSVGEIPILVHVASRLRPLVSQSAVLRAHEHVPDLEIAVAREEEQVVVTLTNRSPTGAGEVRVDVSGAFRVLETLAAESQETVELPLSGKATKLMVTLRGPLTSRRVEIPLPDPGATLTVVAPRVQVQRGGFPGFERIRVTAGDPSGLRHGWISLDEEKETYDAWHGRSSGSLSLSLPKGEHTLLTKVETASGISLFDRRVFTKD